MTSKRTKKTAIAPEKRGNGMTRLLQVVAMLRGRHGCPWDREQTLETLRPYLLEEAYELLDAVESGDSAHHMEELGDVLLQVVLHAQIRHEQKNFDFDDVAHAIARKLIRRHPHVFDKAIAKTSQAVIRNWEAIKLTEKPAGRRSVIDGVPKHLPALLKAQRVQAKAARVGFDWNDHHGVLDKLEEETRELRQALRGKRRSAIQEEMGDVLFSLVNLCRFLAIDAEDALRLTTRKFCRRFKEVETRVDREGRKMADCSLAELEQHWQAVKKTHRKNQRPRRRTS
jgi:tetrapyrrole methylase family protein/MazG family protein